MQEAERFLEAARLQQESRGNALVTAFAHAAQPVRDIVRILVSGDTYQAQERILADSVLRDQLIDAESTTDTLMQFGISHALGAVWGFPSGCHLR